MNVLNLALKKEIYEGLGNGTITDIVIEKSNWWKKRLMDVDTGRFREFDVANISCGSAEKLEFEIDSIFLLDDNFVIRIIQPTEHVQPEDEENEQTEDEKGCDEVQPENEQPEDEEDDYEEFEDPAILEFTEGNGEGVEITGIKGTQEDLLKPDGINPVTVETDENGNIIAKTKVFVKPEVTINRIEQKIKLNKDGVEVVNEEEPDIKELIMKVVNKFCSLNDVYVVSMPNVTIRNNGQIFGCNKRLIADRDSDVKFDFVKKEFIMYPGEAKSSLILKVLGYMNSLLKNNYVFINRTACGFRDGDNGNLIFTMYAVSKKKYLFKKVKK